MPMCSGCKKPRPLSWYDKDASNPLGIHSRCKRCYKEKRGKLKIVDPDMDVIPVHEMKLLARSMEKMAEGSWERVVRRAMIATDQEAVVVYVGRNWYAHYTAWMNILKAAKRLKVKVWARHGDKEVYVRPGQKS
jgi:hypothetical protein